MKIRPVKDRLNGYCGPAAISAIAGISTATAAAILRQKNDRRYIKGAFNHEMLFALNHLGYNMSSWSTEGAERRTFAAWLRSTSRMRGRKVFLINMGHHYAVIQGRTYIDNAEREGCWISDAPNRRAVFHRAWIITKAGKPTSMAKHFKRENGDGRKVTPRAPRPEPTKDEVRAGKLAAIEAKLKRWHSKLKRAQTAIRKLSRSRSALQRASATVHEIRPERVAYDHQLRLAA